MQYLYNKANVSCEFCRVLCVPWACFAIELAEGVHTKKGMFPRHGLEVAPARALVAWIDRDRGLTSGSEGHGTSDGWLKTKVLERNESNRIWWESTVDKDSQTRGPSGRHFTRRPALLRFKTKTTTTSITIIISTPRPCRSSTLDLADTEWTLRLSLSRRRL
jgi:hypothetical protein